MTAEDEPPSSPNRVWFLVAAIVVIMLTVGVVVVITVVAFVGSEDTESRLATEAAAARLAARVEGGAVVSCPAGPAEEVLGDVGAALGGGSFAQIVADGEVTVSSDDRAVECVAASADGTLSIVLSPSPAAALARLSGDGAWERLGTSRGGEYVGRCGGDECTIVWSDDHLLAGLSGRGPAFEGVERDRVHAALAAALPSLVGGTAAA